MADKTVKTDFSFSWVFGKLCDLKKKSYTSRTAYTPANDGWSLMFCPDGAKNSTKGFVAVSVRAEQRNPMEAFCVRSNVQITLLCWSASSKKLLANKTFKSDFSSSSSSWGDPDFCKQEILIQPPGDEGITIEAKLLYEMPANKPLETLFELMMSNLDVDFNVNGQIIKADKNIITSRCDYFKAMFSSGMMENQIKGENATVEITDTTAPCFRAMLWFLYSGFLDPHRFTGATLRDLYCLSDKYQISELTTEVENRIMQELTPATALEILLDWAHVYPPLRKSVVEYVLKNVNAIRKCENFEEVMERCDEVEVFRELVMEIVTIL
ncbi:BTB/POZ protein [Jimgerdemannia flammicorona]|uniref:BTB/POZ protein n=1 Tax=Jimgerdemannia flammicorona TaxID=994334 RepID=A0A433D366_9FUNG|nr:BTB/POZ protein [Jimgerdemannia flammicorona]